MSKDKSGNLGTKHSKKCPIYVHDIKSSHTSRTIKINEEGDFAYTSDHKSTKKAHINRAPANTKRLSVMKKLEESYWASWKPDKKDHVNATKLTTDKYPALKDIKYKVQVHPESPTEPEIEAQVVKKSSDVILKKCQEIQTDTLPLILPPSSDKETADKETATKETETQISDDQVDECKPLKHTDSFILTYKKKQEEHEHYEQPKCIRLYKKPDQSTSRSYVKGGSYPLKSCLKQKSSFARGNVRLGRPGSPLIVSSNYGSRRAKNYKN